MLLAALSISRIPLFLFAAVSTVLIPGFTHLVAQGDGVGVRRVLRRLLMAVLTIGLTGVLGSAVIGPGVVDLLYRPSNEPSRAVMALLATSVAIMMVALSVAPALVALERHRAVSLAWCASLATVSLAFVIPGGLLMRVAVALVASSLIATAVLVGALVIQLPRLGRSGRSPAESPTVPVPA